ncbi:hypothetical protein GCM10010207_84110 [Streptomyces atratus]|nr:hypothetical protein GCM10010207_84110 [Streptomyces atratus]
MTPCQGDGTWTKTSPADDALRTVAVEKAGLQSWRARFTLFGDHPPKGPRPATGAPMIGGW